MSLRKYPSTVENLRTRPIEPNQVIPTWCDRQAVRGFTITAELDGHGTVGISLGRDTVDRIGVKWVLFEVAVGVIDGDRPEAIYRYILDGEPMYGLSVIFLWRDIQIGSPESHSAAHALAQRPSDPPNLRECELRQRDIACQSVRA